MGNHFHLLLETPSPNLVAGMQWMMGVYAQGWNRRRKRRGHVFQGRYKSVIVDNEHRSEGYFRTVADYIHLNPVRAGLVGGDTKLKLNSYVWSSASFYGRKSPPWWLETGRVLEEFELSADKSGARSYASYLEARCVNKAALVNDESLKILRRGWCVGSVSFRKKVMDMLSEQDAIPASTESLSSDALKDLNTAQAEALATRALEALGMPIEANDLYGWGKFKMEKDLIIALLRQFTPVSNKWIAKRLGIGHPSRISIAVRKVRDSQILQQRLAALAIKSKVKI